MQHYLQTKEEYKDCILFYRLGDFYEMFFEDAKTVSKELELTLTGKSCGLEERAPDVRGSVSCRQTDIQPAGQKRIQSSNL